MCMEMEGEISERFSPKIKLCARTSRGMNERFRMEVLGKIGVYYVLYFECLYREVLVDLKKLE